MRAGVMAAELLEIVDRRRTATREQATPAKVRLQSVASWNPENFAREQIRRLVRQVFFSSAPQPKRHVLFSAVEPGADLGSICLRVAQTLAMETSASVAVVGSIPQDADTLGSCLEDASDDSSDGSMLLRKMAMRLASNLWLLPDQSANASHNSVSVAGFFGGLRNEFEYSIVQAPPAGESSRATEMAKAADGLILVLSAQHTRRASALRVKQMMEEAEVRILGTVLTDREFPIPERIYRRL